MRPRTSIIFFLVVAALMINAYLTTPSRGEIRKENERYRAELDDMSIPPRLPPLMADPSWTVAHWIDAGKMPFDCVQANDLMDQGLTERRTRRSLIATLDDYLRSCSGAADRAAKQVDPVARKWCAYRTQHQRFDVLCTEWTENREQYLAEMRLHYRNTLLRYEQRR